MTHTFEFDPSQVLAISPSASLEQIRDAYRLQSKKHHPDRGGDEWAFRLVSQSYEILSRARVAGRVAREVAGASPKPAEPIRRPERPGREGQVRRGPEDRHVDPGRIVDVELLFLRFDLSGAVELLLSPAEQRNLSCCLNVRWPGRDPNATGQAAQPPEDDLAPRVAEAFDRTRDRTRAVSSWEEAGDGHFSGWLGYPTARRTAEAADRLREELAGMGLGARQWTREMIIPRDRT